MTAFLVCLGVLLFAVYVCSVIQLYMGPFPESISDDHPFLKELMCWLIIAYSIPALVALILLMIIFYPLIEPTIRDS